MGAEMIVPFSRNTPAGKAGPRSSGGSSASIDVTGDKYCREITDCGKVLLLQYSRTGEVLLVTRTSSRSSQGWATSNFAVTICCAAEFAGSESNWLFRKNRAESPPRI